MKRIGIISTAVLSLALGVGAPVYAQQEQRDKQEEEKAKPAQGEKKAQPEKSAKQEEKPAARQEKSAKPEEQTHSSKARHQSEEKKAHSKTRTPGTKENTRSSNMRNRPNLESRSAPNGNGGGRIPDDRFKANFGEQHRFRVSQGDYSRDRRFQYGGYWFGFVDPWPSNWLYTQDVYVVEINGVYYLCNPMYPGVNILLSVTL